jgi:hypothetical protein
MISDMISFLNENYHLSAVDEGPADIIVEMQATARRRTSSKFMHLAGEGEIVCRIKYAPSGQLIRRFVEKEASDTLPTEGGLNYLLRRLTANAANAVFRILTTTELSE